MVPKVTGHILNHLPPKAIIVMRLPGLHQVISPRHQLSLPGTQYMEPIVTLFKYAFGVVTGMISRVARSTIHGLLPMVYTLVQPTNGVCVPIVVTGNIATGQVLQYSPLCVEIIAMLLHGYIPPISPTIQQH